MSEDVTAQPTGLSLATSSRSNGKRYAPCRNGVHVCGADEEANEFYTERNFPSVNRRAFERARLECAASTDEPSDFVVDFMLYGDIEDDFRVTRQMLNRLSAILNEPRNGPRPDASNPRSPPNDPHPR